MTAEEPVILQKQLINLRLQNLGAVPKIPKPTKMELFQKRRLLHRVQLKENKRFRENITKQQKDLQVRKIAINKYLQDFEAEELRRAEILASLTAAEEPPVFGPLPSYDIKPLDKFPIRKQTRLSKLPRLQDPSVKRIKAIPRKAINKWGRY